MNGLMVVFGIVLAIVGTILLLPCNRGNKKLIEMFLVLLMLMGAAVIINVLLKWWLL